MPQSANWSFPTQIRFGVGRVAELAPACTSTGITRPLLVTDSGLISTPIAQRALRALEESGMSPSVFSDIRPNPVEANLDAGVRAFRSGEHDGVVAFGGGSALDTGKLIAFMSGQTLPVWEFEDIGDNWKKADSDNICPIVAVPTAAGTGSEVGRAGVVTHEDSHTKKVIFHPRMLPAIVISDPELTVGLPPRITAGTGLDAFAHCLEAYCAPAYHPMCEGIAVEGMRLVAEALPAAYRDGTDLDARGKMMSAAAMGAVAFQKGLGAVHSLSHPVGALYDTHHGMTNAVFMPYVLNFNRTAIEGRIRRLAAFLELPSPGFAGFLDYVLALRQELGVPHTVAEFGVDDKQMDRIAAMAVQDPTAGGNPLPLDEAGAREIFANAYAGRL